MNDLFKFSEKQIFLKDKIDLIQGAGIVVDIKKILIKLKLLMYSFHISYNNKENGNVRNVKIENYISLKLILAGIITPIIGFACKKYFINAVFEIFGYVGCIWFTYSIIENIHYSLTNILCPQAIEEKKPSGTPERKLILLFLDYFLLTLEFAGMYYLMICLNKTGYINSLYFSFVTSFTVGYGDVTPSGDFGKVLVIFQISCTLLFTAMFFGFYSSKFLNYNNYNEKGSSSNIDNN